MEVSDAAVVPGKDDDSSDDEKEVSHQSWKDVPHGRPKSGRLCKDPKPVRFEISHFKPENTIYGMTTEAAVKVSNRSGAGNCHFRDLQTMLERQKSLNFLPEMQSKVTTNCDKSSWTAYKRWGFGWVHC